jgi:hypothetical protein
MRHLDDQRESVFDQWYEALAIEARSIDELPQRLCV